MSNEDFGDLKFATSQQPDDGCDWAAVIIWEMRSRARIRAQINTTRPVPVSVMKVKKNADKKSAKTKRAKSGKRPAGTTGGNGNAAAGGTRKKRAP